jgi:hypothetical protein
VAADEVYGADPDLRAELELAQIGYVRAIGSDRRVPTGAGLQLTAGLPRHARQRLSAGTGAEGRRLHDWALLTLTAPADAPETACWWLLVRRHRDNGEWRRSTPDDTRERPQSGFTRSGLILGCGA